MDMGVRELKQRLSEVIRRAADGETIRVTDRGVPKVVIGPLPGKVRIEEGIADGWITPGTDLPIASVTRSRATRRVLDVLADDRGQ